MKKTIYICCLVLSFILGFIINLNNNLMILFWIWSSGDVSYQSYVLSYNAVRPNFYLKSDVAYVSGTGTITDPYRIA